MSVVGDFDVSHEHNTLDVSTVNGSFVYYVGMHRSHTTCTCSGPLHTSFLCPLHFCVLCTLHSSLALHCISQVTHFILPYHHRAIGPDSSSLRMPPGRGGEGRVIIVAGDSTPMKEGKLPVPLVGVWCVSCLLSMA